MLSGKYLGEGRNVKLVVLLIGFFCHKSSTVNCNYVLSIMIVLFEVLYTSVCNEASLPCVTLCSVSD